jgi:hypothetical protein
METDENSHPIPGSILDPLGDVYPSDDRHIRNKRRRKLIIDEVTTISGEEMKSNMADFRLVKSFIV